MIIDILNKNIFALQNIFVYVIFKKRHAPYVCSSTIYNSQDMETT